MNARRPGGKCPALGTNIFPAASSCCGKVCSSPTSVTCGRSCRTKHYFTPMPRVPAGYKYDECSAEALIARMKVKDGRLVLPDGMSYRLLMLPETTTLMTPALVGKIKQLVAAGATVVGPRPTASPSLSDFPKCDEEVASLAAEVWGNCDGKAVTEHAFGRGRIIWGQPLEDVLEESKMPADFSSSVKLNWIHRQMGDTQVYFVANETAVSVEAKCNFRVKGLRPNCGIRMTGEISAPAVYEETAAGISIPLRLEASGSIFMVFRPQRKEFDPVVSFMRDGEPCDTADQAAGDKDSESNLWCARRRPTHARCARQSAGSGGSR